MIGNYENCGGREISIYYATACVSLTSLYSVWQLHVYFLHHAEIVFLILWLFSIWKTNTELDDCILSVCVKTSPVCVAL